MSLFDVIRYQPVPEPLTMEWLNSLPEDVHFRYRAWLKRENNYSGIGYEMRKYKILQLLEKYE